LAFAFPLLGAAALVQDRAVLRGDQAVLAAFHQAEAWSGGLTTLLARGCLDLPLGNLSFRLALPCVLGAGLLGWACFELAYALFRAQGGYSRLDPWLAWGASLVGALNLPAISEGTVAGGATLGPALGLLGCVRLVNQQARHDLPSTLGYALAWGALLCESMYVALLLLLAAALLWPQRIGLERDAVVAPSYVSWWRWPVAASVALLAAGGIAVANGWFADGWAVGQSISKNFVPGRPWTWVAALGWLWCLGAALATVFALQDRRPLYVMGLFGIADWLIPAAGDLGWVNAASRSAGRTDLHLLALGYLAAGGARGLRTFGETAQALGLLGARQLSTLLSVVAVAGGIAASEDALTTLNQTAATAAEAWTSEALYELPPRTLIITHSVERGRRLRAAQLQGARPDVLIVPLTELTQGQNVATWMKREPALQLLLIDLSLGSIPSERALSTLVDARPVYVEPTPDWDPRLLEHLEPGVPLSRLWPHALARSDRLRAWERSPSSTARVFQAAQAGVPADEAMLNLLREDFQQLAATLARVDSVAQKRVAEASPFAPRASVDAAQVPLATAGLSPRQ
jgi:hypothetical protein